MALLKTAKAAILTTLLLTSHALEQKPLHDAAAKGSAGGNPLNDDFRKYVTGLMEEWHVPGLSVAVIDKDQVYTQGYGFAILPDTPVTPDTLFLGGSTTKAHLAAALAHLISSGDHAEFPLGWQTPISSIIRDDFVLQDEWATTHLTLEDAVSHRTGMPRHDAAWSGTRDRNDTASLHSTNKATVRKLRDLPPTAQPRVAFQYCNLMFVTLSHVVETVTGSWLGDVLRSVIWAPLGMDSTFLSYRDARKSGKPLAMGYFWDDDAQEYVAVEEDPVQFSSGAGAIITNAVDYSKWVGCLLRRAAPFSAATHEEIRTTRMLVIPKPAPDFGLGSYGLGWIQTSFHGEMAYHHNGGTQNFGTNVFWMPDLDFAVIGFANAVDTGNLVEELLTWKLVEDKLGIPAEKRLDRSKGKKEQMEQAIRDFDNATDILYPNHATDPPSFAVDYDLLAGTYRDAGYGDYEFSVETASLTGQDSPQPQLVAVRRDLIVPSKMVLRHVVGDYWVAYVMPVLGSAASRGFTAARFVTGPDGKPEALEVTWAEGEGPVSGYKTVFARVK